MASSSEARHPIFRALLRLRGQAPTLSSLQAALKLLDVSQNYKDQISTVMVILVCGLGRKNQLP